MNRSRAAVPFLLSVLALTGLQGCAIGLVKSLHDVSYLEQAPIPKNATTREISQEFSENVILGMIGNTRFVEEDWKTFQQLCPRGTIMNPFARYSTDLGFFAYKLKLHFSGTCVQGLDVH
jgi:hypothetical protein